MYAILLCSKKRYILIAYDSKAHTGFFDSKGSVLKIMMLVSTLIKSRYFLIRVNLLFKSIVKNERCRDSSRTLPATVRTFAFKSGQIGLSTVFMRHVEDGRRVTSLGGGGPILLTGRNFIGTYSQQLRRRRPCSQVYGPSIISSILCGMVTSPISHTIWV